MTADLPVIYNTNEEIDLNILLGPKIKLKCFQPESCTNKSKQNLCLSCFGYLFIDV